MGFAIEHSKTVICVSFEWKKPVNLLSSLQIETMSDDLGVTILGTHNVPSGND